MSMTDLEHRVVAQEEIHKRGGPCDAWRERMTWRMALLFGGLSLAAVAAPFLSGLYFESRRDERERSAHQQHSTEVATTPTALAQRAVVPGELRKP